MPPSMPVLPPVRIDRRPSFRREPAWPEHCILVGAMNVAAAEISVAYDRGCSESSHLVPVNHASPSRTAAPLIELKGASAPGALEEVLRARFGLADFRPWQREAIEASSASPAGRSSSRQRAGGKSLTYQLPAAVLGGTTLVLSPLVALMEDQVRALEARGHRGDVPRVDARLRGAPQAARRAPRGAGTRSSMLAPERLASERFSRCSRAARSSSSRSTRRTASRSGATTSAPTTCASARSSSDSARPACSPAPRRRRRTCARRSRAQLGFLPGEYEEVLRGFARPNLHLAAQSVEGAEGGHVARSSRRSPSALGEPRARAEARSSTRRRAAQPRRERDSCASAAGTRARTTRGWTRRAHVRGERLRGPRRSTDRRRDERLRDGDRSRRHPRRRPRAAAGVDRVVLPGGGARGARR